QTYTQHVPGRRGPTVDPAVLTDLAAACRDRRALRFDYADRRGEASQRRVEPYPVVNWAPRWYLVAWDPDRDAWRTFPIDPLQAHISRGTPFKPRELSDAEVEALVSRGVPHVARRFQARILVHVAAATLNEKIGPWVGTVTAIDDGTCVL